MKRRFAVVFIGAALSMVPGSARAQAFTPPAGVGAVTVALQYVDNTGHWLSDRTFFATGESVTVSALLEVDYAVTDRLAVSAGVPYVFAKYTGGLPPFSGLPRDVCRCWHSAVQDLALAARYRFGDHRWAVTPGIRYLLPTHDYPHEGEAVVGRNLEEIQASLFAGMRLSGAVRNASIQGGYSYAFVEKPLPDVSINRSNGFVDLGYHLSDRYFIRLGANYTNTHGGLRFGSPTGNPFFPPGELNTPERWAQRDRVLATEQWQVGVGLAYDAGPVDVFASVMKYVWGRESHNGRVYTVGTTWYFDGGR